MPTATSARLDRRASETLFGLLDVEKLQHGPTEAISEALGRLSAPGVDGSAANRYFWLACGWAEGELEGLDRLEPYGREDIWLETAAAIVRPYVLVTEPVPADILGYSEWLAIAGNLHVDGPGATVTPQTLFGYLRDIPDIAAMELAEVDSVLATVCDLWRELGVLDADQRLTPLGHWGVPAALFVAWETTDDEDEEDEEFAANLEAAGAVEFVKRRWDDDPTSITAEEWNEAAELLRERADALSLTIVHPGWAEFLEQMYAVTSGSQVAAGPAFLRALCAEAAGDTVSIQHWLDVALAADQVHLDSLLLATELASATGDAPLARDLLRRVGVPADDSDLAIYLRFSRRPEGGPSRNAPCSCGSGRKYKLCCGQRVGHPLESRGNWIWLKALHFLHRPRNHFELMKWAALRRELDDQGADPEVIRAALTDLLVWDCALFDGGLLETFLEVRGPLLPADERATVESWRDTVRAAYEVIDVRAGFSVTVRDLTDDSIIVVQERQASQELRPGDLLLTRILPVGAVAMFGFVTGVPRLMRSSLVGLLAQTQEAAPLLRWLDQAERPPEVQTTEGEELLHVTQQWKVGDDGWDELSETLTVDAPDELSEWFVGPHSVPYVRGRLTRSGDQVTMTTNSAPRADRLAEMLIRAGGSLISETRETMAETMRRPHAVSDPIEMTPEIAAALDNVVRAHERGWIDDEIPMFKGRTPREMVKTAAGRREVEAFLEDMDVANERAGGYAPGAMDPGRIRELLDLPPHIDRR